MIRSALLALLVVPAVGLAGGSAFDGTWRARLDSVKVTGTPDAWTLANGSYGCSSCSPPLAGVPADGAFHKVTGHDYYDEIMVRVLDPRTVEISQKQGGKLMGVNTMQVSADGATLSGKFTGYAGSEPVTGTYTEKRVGSAPPGAHPVSGSWLQDQFSSGNDALRSVQYAMTPEQFSMHANGQGYTARFDGHKYPIEGDPGQTLVTVKKINVRTVHETDYRGGKVVDEIEIAAAADGKTLLVTDRDVAHGQVVTMIYDRQ